MILLQVAGIATLQDMELCKSKLDSSQDCVHTNIYCQLGVQYFYTYYTKQSH
jgi:hypothetical protein